MSLEQMQLLAYAAGYGAVSEDDIDIQREAPFDDTIAVGRTGRNFVPGWHVPDAPAPRTMRIAHGQSTAVAIVEPLWRTPVAKPVVTWAQHLTSVGRSMSALIPGRGVPA